MLTLGDNMQSDPSPTGFATVFNSTWGRVKPIIHPEAGNHDYGYSGAKGYYGHFGAAAGELFVGFPAGHRSTQPITATPGWTSLAQQTSSAGTPTSVVACYTIGGSSPLEVTASFASPMYWAAGVAAFRSSG